MILIISISAAAAAAALPAPTAPGPQPLRRAVALLDYVAGDYARAVSPSGELLSPSEHQEQIRFVQDAAQEVRADVDGTGEDLARRLDQLAREVESRAPPATVGASARRLRDEIVQRFHVVLLPPAAPDLSRGARAYQEACAACHGADGHPNLSLGLLTRLPDFTRPEDTGPLSPQRVFNAATYGVPDTQMPAFDTGLTDPERWDVAFFVLALGRPAATGHGLSLARAALAPTRYTDLASLSDDELRARLASAGLSAPQQEEALSALRAGPFSEAPAAAQGLAQARHDVQKAVQLARKGEAETARRLLVSAYLDGFEPHEAMLRARDAGLVRDVETAFLSLRASIESGKEVEASAGRLDALLEKADARPAGGAFIAVAAALAIALREGAEAAILVAAMLALLRKAGRERDAHAVHVGWISALAAGALTWYASGLLLAHVSGTNREWIEGVLQLVLAALILYASHWLFASMHSRRLVSIFFQRSMAGASALVVLAITFVAVYREMFETVLFFRGLMLEEPGKGGAVAAGALSGVAVLMAMVALFGRIGRKLKPRLVLMICGALLSGLAVLMVGNGVRSLQLVGVLPLTVWGAFELPALGLYATREGLLAQALVLLGLLGSALWSSMNHRGKGGPPGRPAPIAV